MIEKQNISRKIFLKKNLPASLLVFLFNGKSLQKANSSVGV